MADARQHIMNGGIIGVKIVHISSCYEWQMQPLAQRDQAIVEPPITPFVMAL